MPSYTPVKYFGAESKETPVKQASNCVIVDVRPNPDNPETPFVRIAFETMQQDSIGDAFACSTARHAVSGKVAMSMAQECAGYFNASSILVFDSSGALAEALTGPATPADDSKTKTVPTRRQRGGVAMVA